MKAVFFVRKAPHLLLSNLLAFIGAFNLKIKNLHYYPNLHPQLFDNVQKLSQVRFFVFKQNLYFLQNQPKIVLVLIIKPEHFSN